MPFAAALSTQGQTAAALGEVCARALEQLQGPPDLALLFFSLTGVSGVARRSASPTR